MANEWREDRFGSLVRYVSEKSQAKDASVDTYVSTESMVVNFGGVTPASAFPLTGSVTKFKIGDTLFSNIRTYFKKVWQARFDGCCSNDVLVLRPINEKVLAPDYLYHICRWEKFTELSIRTSKGAKMPRGDKDALASFKFLLPPIEEQRAIAHVLGTLDDKIELNRRRNETLEAMARTLFKDWFVDFGPVRAKMEGREPYLPEEVWRLFPERLVESELGEIPEGWKERPLDEIANFLNGIALQKFPATDTSKSIPVIKIAELRNGISANSNRASVDIPDKYIVRNGDFLFSWSGSLMAKFWSEGDGALNQHLFKVTSDQCPMWFVSHWVHYHLEEFQAIAASKATTMGHIQRAHLTAAKTVCPPAWALSSMDVTMTPLVEQTIKNELESHTLAALRDTLLPKLISSELRVSDAEQKIEDALT